MKIDRATFAYLNPLLLIVWFFIWGICPWGNPPPPAQAAEDHPASHAHSGSAETHHGSKGAEHSCSGSISYSKSDLGSDPLLNRAGAVEATVLVADRSAGLRCPPYFFESTSLPRLLTAYYQLYSVYRI